MIECQTKFFIGVCFWIVLVDPTREASADELGILGDGGPVGVMFDLRVNEGHLLRTGDALVSVKLVGHLGRKEKLMAGTGSYRNKSSLGAELTAVCYTLLWQSTRYFSHLIADKWPGLSHPPSPGWLHCPMTAETSVRCRPPGQCGPRVKSNPRRGRAT